MTLYEKLQHAHSEEEVKDFYIEALGLKSYTKGLIDLPNETFLNMWLIRPKPNSLQVIPLKNAITPYLSTKYLDKWSDDTIGYMWCQNNDLQHTSQQTALFSSV